MANTPAIPVVSLPTSSARERASAASEGKLCSALPMQQVRIIRIEQEDEHAAWLRAVGMHEGAEVTVLRRAPFGGPIHLRSSDGGEFAIHRDLARCIEVVVVETAGDRPGSPGSTA